MDKKEKNILTIMGLLFIFSLVSGGASAILLQGLAYDILYAIHKVTSVIGSILFVVYVWIRFKED
ncbi:MAG: hypothetical protein BAJALOKI1v1_790010 [Promethearchaeota archaeon]|nr:MAG: hypothetical protein BAJALOKI1v1_790010 [Candidatus Lokiarchaeota archaeon]